MTGRHYYVTQAWTEHPVKDVLVKMAATPALTRVGSELATASSPRHRGVPGIIPRVIPQAEFSC